MFEKEAETKLSEEDYKLAEETIKPIYRNAIKNDYSFAKYGVECYLAGYNKANEWHYVKDEGTPKVEGHYLVCLRNKNKDIFDCWIYYDKDVGWYSMKVRMKDIYAWKEIVLPELKESE